MKRYKFTIIWQNSKQPTTKAKQTLRFNSYRGPEAAHAASAALCVTDEGWRSDYAAAQDRTHGLWPAATQPYVAKVCLFNSVHSRNAWEYMDYYSFTDPDGMEG